MRKIIQINSSTSKFTNSNILNALCDDGTVWQKIGGNIWQKISAIPQDEAGLNSELPQDEPQK